MKILKVELKKSKDGEPMVSVWKKDNNDMLIFQHFILTTGFGIHCCNEFLRLLHTGIEIKFVNFKQYHELLQRINKQFPFTIKSIPADTEESILRSEVINKIQGLSIEQLKELMVNIA
ncbi:Uncharacterised protein [Clostridium carnis]|uniref:Uncharacterized protein n=1 Tax=Clostridium carnis TaxID=1530 RepID=A0ABY6T216_9CLOT|nr:hypothetical protein [Clostridium carnis]VDG74684.1 Uncharacterised protein [Clostridium carnis]